MQLCPEHGEKRDDSCLQCKHLEKSLVDFLKTDTPKEELAIALKVLREFKGYESYLEWLRTPFMCWARLEMLEEFLAHLAEGEELQDDTKRQLEEKT